jgi:hypothetical protein
MLGANSNNFHSCRQDLHNFGNRLADRSGIANGNLENLLASGGRSFDLGLQDQKREVQ